MKSMHSLVYTLIAYSLLLNIGGITGYAMAGSVVSFAMGTTFGFAFLGCAYALLKNVKYAKGISLALSLLLLIVFSIRFIKTGSFFPAGMMALASLSVASLIIRSFFQSPCSPSLVCIHAKEKEKIERE